MKKENWMWLPLSLAVLCNYAIKRGLAAFTKTDMVPIFMQQAWAIYAFTAAATMFVAGFVLDNVSARKAILFATACGVASLLLLPYSAWGFGIFYGITACLFKLVPFGTVMKVKETGKDVWHIAPQAAAKMVGPAIWTIGIGALIIASGLAPSMVLAAGVMLCTGLVAYIMMPDAKLEGWNWRYVVTLFKKPKFLLFLLWYAIFGVAWWIIMFALMPALLAIGITTSTALLIIALAYFMGAALRWPWIYIGSRIGHFLTLWIGLIIMVLGYTTTFVFPVIAPFIFTLGTSSATVNYWPMVKKNWGKEYVNTCIALGSMVMYICIGIVLGRW